MVVKDEAEKNIRHSYNMQTEKNKVVKKKEAEKQEEKTYHI